MKNIISALALVLIFASCEKETETIPPEILEPSALMEVNGQLHCLNNNPISAVDITLTDISGSTQTTITDATGSFTFENLIDGDYTIKFENTALFNYSDAQYVNTYEDIEDIVLAERNQTNVDHLAYNIINYDDGLTTLDMVLFDKLKSGELLLSEVESPWRYVFTSELDTNDAITDQLSFTHTEETNLDITAVFIGDNSGYTCP